MGYIGSQKLWCKCNQYQHSKWNSRQHDNVPVHRYCNESRQSCQLLFNWILKFIWIARYATAHSNIENWRAHHSSMKNHSTMTATVPGFQWKSWWTTLSKLQFKTETNDSNKYAFRIQTFAVSGATRLCNDHKQSTRTIATSMWTEFGKSMLLTWTAVCGMLTRRKTFRFFLCMHQKVKQKIGIVYSNALQ